MNCIFLNFRATFASIFEDPLFRPEGKKKIFKISGDPIFKYIICPHFIFFFNFLHLCELDELESQRFTHLSDFSKKTMSNYKIFPLFFQEFDKKYNPTWHCIVGRNFGSYVTHETRHFIYFYLGQVAILLFKSG